MQKVVPCALLFSLVVLLYCGRNSTREPVASARTRAALSVVFSNLSMVGHLYQVYHEAFAEFTRETGIPVVYIPGEDKTSKRLQQHLGWLNQHATTPDVYDADFEETRYLAEHMIDLGPYLGEEAKRHIPAIIKNFTVDGRLVAMPYLTDIGLLYYRTDLLEKYGYAGPPETWDELERMAARIQAGERAAGNKDFWGFAWAGERVEGLTILALEWQASSGGGLIIEPDKTISVNNPRTIRALERARRWVGTISPAAVTTYDPEDAKNLWLSGKAAFMRNWCYVYAASQKEDSAVQGKVDATVLPSGGAGHVGILGGWQLSVSQYSAHPREAVDFVRYFAGRKAQLRRAVQLSALPTLLDLYDDPEVIGANPDFARIKAALLQTAVARPTAAAGKSYYDVSTAYRNAVHSVLTGQARAPEAVAKLEQQLVKLTGFRTAGER